MRLLAQQGWQCPICMRVYSPTTPMCFTCGGNVSTQPKPNTEGTAIKGACSNCWGSGVGINGWPCAACKRVTMFTDKISTGTGVY